MHLFICIHYILVSVPLLVRQRGTCLMHNMKGNVIQSTWYSLGFPRGSPLREKVNTM